MSPANQNAAIADKDQVREPVDGFTRAPGQRPGMTRPGITQMPGQEGMPLKKKKSKAPLLILSAMALTFIGVFGAAQYQNSHKAPSKAPEVAAVSGLESLLPGQAAPASMPASGQVAPAAKPLTPPDPPVLRSEFSQLQATVDQMQKSITSIQETQSAIRAESSALHDELEKLSKSVSAQRHAAARAKPKVEAKVETPAPAPQPSANVLSVDSWDGRQSVSVSQGGQIKFLNEGDSIGGYVLKSADGRKQQAEFVTPDGQSRRVRASEAGQ